MITAEDVKINLADSSIYQIYDEAVEYFDNDSIFVELGAFQGASTIYLAQSKKKNKKNIIVYAVDLWENMTAPNRDISKPTVEGSIFFEFWQNVWDAECEQIIKPVQFDSSAFAKSFQDRSVDFVFIDGDHSYLGVSKDINEWLPKIKPGGWMGGHDYNQQVEIAVADILIDREKKKVVKCKGDGVISKNCNSFICKEI